MVAEVQGDLMGSKTLHDFSYKYLLIPSVLHWPNSSFPIQYTVSSTTASMYSLITDLQGQSFGALAIAIRIDSMPV